MKTPFCACLTLALLLAACDEKADKRAAGPNAGNSAQTPPQNAPAGYLGALNKGQQTAIKTIDTTSVDKAIQMFAVENGRNPKSLNELVEQKYLPKIPDAPYGTKLVYDAGSGTVKVVSQ